MQMLDRRAGIEDFPESRPNNARSSFGPPSHLTHSPAHNLAEIDDDIPF